MVCLRVAAFSLAECYALMIMANTRCLTFLYIPLVSSTVVHKCDGADISRHVRDASAKTHVQLQLLFLRCVAKTHVSDHHFQSVDDAGQETS